MEKAIHNNIILDLLFSLNEWMSLAKLRLHTDTTLDLLERSTTALGQNLRRFVVRVCEDFATQDLPQEESARGRRIAAINEKARMNSNTSQSQSVKTKKRRQFNLKMYKLHSLGDYVESIKRFGTTDSYSTQLVSKSACSSNLNK